ncbi:hypothetical protein Bbelb_248190 [Branchiostoma belcheri]|nr:hypothetical protein Bbelb_248190 [Branchiostoma belcheri]
MADFTRVFELETDVCKCIETRPYMKRQWVVQGCWSTVFSARYWKVEPIPLLLLPFTSPTEVSLAKPAHSPPEKRTTFLKPCQRRNVRRSLNWQVERRVLEKAETWEISAGRLTQLEQMSFEVSFSAAKCSSHYSALRCQEFFCKKKAPSTMRLLAILKVTIVRRRGHMIACFPPKPPDDQRRPYATWHERVNNRS